jgi:hypothetical protein
MKKIIKIIKGLEILREYDDYISVEHNIIYAGPIINMKKIKPDDIMLLEDLDWLFEEGNGWSFLV